MNASMNDTHNLSAPYPFVLHSSVDRAHSLEDNSSPEWLGGHFTAENCEPVAFVLLDVEV
jgi:hypothetical protein